MITSVLSFLSTQGPERYWQSRVAWVFRNLADRIDGRVSMALGIYTDPGLPDEVVGEALDQGMEHAYHLLREAVTHEAVEQAFCETYPELLP